MQKNFCAAIVRIDNPAICCQGREIAVDASPKGKWDPAGVTISYRVIVVMDLLSLAGTPSAKPLHREGWYQKRRRHETGKLITPEGTTVGEKMAVRCLSIRPLQAQSRKEGSRQRQSQP